MQAQTSRPNLSVYPNPTTEYIAVQDNNETVNKVLVFNLLGRKVKEFEYVKDDHFYVADLAKGMYLVQLVDHNNRTLTTQKVEKR